jgi:hypothetical protein
MDPDTPPPSTSAPPTFNYILGFLLVGLAWGFTTPFIRRAAVDFNKRNEGASVSGGEDDADTSGKAGKSWLRNKIRSIFWTVINLLRTPAYAIPLVINLTGSVWFFLLVGKHGTVQESLSYPRKYFFDTGSLLTHISIEFDI